MDLFSAIDKDAAKEATIGKYMPDSWFKELDGNVLLHTSKILDKISMERIKGTTIYPYPRFVFKAYETVAPDNVKVVIIGQDPYYDGNANGLAFGCGKKMSPSLRGMMQAVTIYFPDEDISKINCTLDNWANQGVFLLNTVLTVEHGKPRSHKTLGWDALIEDTIQVLNRRDNIIWMLWGKDARALESKITNSSHTVMTHEHPVMASRTGTTWNCNHFYKANMILAENQNQIQWWI